MDKVVLILIFFLSAISTSAQFEIERIVSLSTTTAEVLNILGTPSSSVAGTSMTFESDRGFIVVNYYSKGCDSETEKNLRLAPGQVLEVRSVPRSNSVTMEKIDSKYSFESFEAHGAEKLYYAADEGLVVISQRSDYPQLSKIKEMFRLPPKAKLVKCIIDLISDSPGYKKLELFDAVSKGKAACEFPPRDIGSYLLSESKATQDQVLNDFTSALSERDFSVGLVHITPGRRERSSDFSSRRFRVLQILIGKGIDCSRIFFIVEAEAQPKYRRIGFSIASQSFVASLGYKDACSS